MKYSTERQWQGVKEKVIDLYVEQKKTIKEAAKEVNIPYYIVQRRLKKLGLLRSVSEALKISLRQGKGNWKGGRVKCKGGYIKALAPDHPRARKDGYVPEHILVWEEYHGRLLPQGWIVHHINDRKDDNRPENLLGMPKKCHRYNLMLKAAVARIRRLEAEVIKLRAERRLGEVLA